MLAQEIAIPVYFAKWTPQLETIVTEMSHSSLTNVKSKSGAEAMFTSVAANGYQIVVNPGSPNVKHEVKVATIQGNLAGQDVEGKVPTVAVVAHYDTFGVAPVCHSSFLYYRRNRTVVCCRTWHLVPILMVLVSLCCWNWSDCFRCCILTQKCVEGTI